MSLPPLSGVAPGMTSEGETSGSDEKNPDKAEYSAEAGIETDAFHPDAPEPMEEKDAEETR
jgi:hypothetical protein